MSCLSKSVCTKSINHSSRTSDIPHNPAPFPQYTTLPAPAAMDDPTDLSASDWAKGVALSVLASVIGAGSKFCIRRSWLMLRDDGEGDGDGEDGSGDGPPAAAAAALRRRSLLLRGTGMVGMTFLNPLCSVLAMNYASPSILAPFSGLTLVWIVLLSGRLLGEDPTRPQLAAASLIVLGETVVAAFGDHTNEEGRTVADVVASYRDPAFLAYLAALAAWMAALGGIMYRGRGGRGGGDHGGGGRWQRLAWGASGGSITGLQNFLKDALTCAKASSGGRVPGTAFVLALLAALSSFSGLLFLVGCMRRYDATYSSAMFVGSFVVSASLMSAVHYATFRMLAGWWNYVLYPAGLLILMGGVAILVEDAGRDGGEGGEDGTEEGVVHGGYTGVPMEAVGEQQEGGCCCFAGEDAVEDGGGGGLDEPLLPASGRGLPGMS